MTETPRSLQLGQYSHELSFPAASLFMHSFSGSVESRESALGHDIAFTGRNPIAFDLRIPSTIVRYEQSPKARQPSCIFFYLRRGHTPRQRKHDSLPGNPSGLSILGVKDIELVYSKPTKSSLNFYASEHRLAIRETRWRSFLPEKRETLAILQSTLDLFQPSYAPPAFSTTVVHADLLSLDLYSFLTLTSIVL